MIHRPPGKQRIRLASLRLLGTLVDAAQAAGALRAVGVRRKRRDVIHEDEIGGGHVLTGHVPTGHVTDGSFQVRVVYGDGEIGDARRLDANHVRRHEA